MSSHVGLLSVTQYYLGLSPNMTSQLYTLSIRASLAESYTFRTFVNHLRTWHHNKLPVKKRFSTYR
ncbi:uncharacterized protein DS421_10g293740 [Arachis hypogaea]|nr:uncharacterized protein DS421_10g293740 [Arachis hypogaea]